MTPMARPRFILSPTAQASEAEEREVQLARIDALIAQFEQEVPRLENLYSEEFAKVLSVQMSYIRQMVGKYRQAEILLAGDPDDDIQRAYVDGLWDAVHELFNPQGDI